MHDSREPHLTAMKCIYAIFRGHQTMVFFCIVRVALTSSSARMLTGPVVQTHAALHPSMWCSWGITWYPGWPSSRLLALRPSITPLPTAWLRPLGYISCSTSSRPCRLSAPLCTMTTSAPCTYLPTPFGINAPRMWRLIFILFERRLPSVKSASSMSR
jgi:hypothetical protein